MKSLFLALAAGSTILSGPALSGPAKAPTAAGIARAAQAGIPKLLACLRNERVPLIGAHRGGPIPEFPENALATFERTAGLIPVFLEIDVQQSFDDQLFLNHDPVLERNMVGYGTIRDMRWAQIAPLKLRDQTGQPTGYTAPLLADALKWADGRALLLLDVKPATDPELLVQAVRAAGAEGRVMYLAYTIKQALGLRKLLPDAVVALPVFDRAGLEAAKTAGLVGDKLLAMVRPDRADAGMIPELEALGATALAGSYGGPQSPDAVYRTSADAGAYQALAAKGPRLIASNRPFEAISAMLKQPGYAAKLARCGVNG
ncbi:glycerophosphodiester phosphodiesterase family protein [Sphingomonas sp. S2-65]|uniref:glycerophosphodiester phosphodiesterase family protein n=1 Tax=Sphingomonas sp. S2-65 TaxID=2903960 RepID=UPI001F24E640|nr:glycerophosphodiester phosphodiesterase family protein [Sphingomonas sp. S2-65]UYY57108.1 glycerophosphodiester phosphodiesterase family protein [Sphingomonas sp. S2-65]